MGEVLRLAGRMRGFPEAGLVLQFFGQADFHGTTLLALQRSQASSADPLPKIRASSWPSQQQGPLAELTVSPYVTKYTQRALPDSRVKIQLHSLQDSFSWDAP